MLVILLIKNRQKKRHNALIFFGERSDPRLGGEEILSLLGGAMHKRDAPTLRVKEESKQRHPPAMRGRTSYATDSNPMP